MNRDLRAGIQDIYRAAIERVDAGHAVRSALNGSDAHRLVIDGVAIPIPDQAVYAIAIGKAAVPMLSALRKVLVGSFVAGIAVTKEFDGASPPDCDVLIGSHPVPDERSLQAGDAVMGFARNLPSGALIVCLISGGGSALVEQLRPGVTLDQLRRVTSQLLVAGASIQELNAVRSRLSAVKAGGLLRALSHATVVNLIVSDVLGDDLQAIASGPTVPPVASPGPKDVLSRYSVEVALPPPDGAGPLTTPLTKIIANVSLAVDAAAEAARSTGYEPIVLTRSIDGEAREAGRLIAAVAADTRRGSTTFLPPVCLLAGGETVVTVRGDGVGGRNTEAALAAALTLSGVEDVAIGFLATDGDDGVTGAAGAIVSGETVPAEERWAAREALAANDSFTFLERIGATWAPGATGTNVNDLVIALIP